MGVMLHRLLCLLVGLVVLGLPAGAAADGACPNEALRVENNSTALPDCRAYEQVTPSYQGGFRISPGLSKVSEDGSQVVSQTFGVYAGAESDSSLSGTYYLFARGGSGWATSPLSVPAAQFPQQEYDDRSPDGSTLWMFHRGDDPIGRQRDLYLRAPDGALSEIGPVLPPDSPNLTNSATNLEYRGASRELSHVLFSTLTSQQATWPFDPTSHAISAETLYEYSGTGNTEPVLVGVSGGRGSNTLISQCGTAFGSERNRDVYNAVSTSGETVFFTAEHLEGCPAVQPPVNELYARVGAEKAIAISEPALPPGARCTGACATAEHEEGVFQGASQDGSKVFFLTEQPLLDGDEEGAGHGMDLYEARIEGGGRDAGIGGLVQVSHDPTSGQSAGVQGVARVSEDGSRVYFVATGVLTEESNGLGQVAQLGKKNLYLYDTVDDRTAFVATLSAEDSRDWEPVDERPVQATPEGRFLAFVSHANLTGDAPDATHQIYRYDADTGGLLRVSIGQEGFNQDGATGFMRLLPLPAVTGGEQLTTGGRAISADGSYVFFESSDGLTPQALNEQIIEGGETANNVYEWEADGVGGCHVARGCLSLISDGKDVSEEEGYVGLELIGSDASGADVFLTTSDPLAASDVNSIADVYDAHVDGGFPAPASVSCSGDACQGAAGSGPVFGAPSSATFSGPGNAASVTTGAPSKPVVGKRTAAEVRAEKLARALKSCRSEVKKPRRRGCEALARKRYGSKARAKAKKSNRRVER
jgi:hypothetical protein